MAAIDQDGLRHLLVPIEPHTILKKGLNGPGLVLRSRPLEDGESYQTYADLSCGRSDLNDLFAGLCANVLKLIAAEPGDPIKILHTVIDRWRSLFATDGSLLGPKQQAGLFAELSVLVELLRVDSSAERLWRGPSGHRHDFSTDRRALEVKATITTEGHSVRVHGLDQLEAPIDGDLRLGFFRLAPTVNEGVGLVELVEAAVNLCTDEAGLRTLLGRAGYRSSDATSYADTRFEISEQAWYSVTEDFPRLTTADVAPAIGVPKVSDVHYTIDLSASAPLSEQAHDAGAGWLLGDKS